MLRYTRIERWQNVQVDTVWALGELERFVKMTGVPPTQRGGLTVGAHQDTVIRQAQVVEQILDRVMPSWRRGKASSETGRWAVHRVGALRAIEQLEREDELREKLGEAAPQLDASTMHPWVWEAAKALWQSNHYREAVNAVAIRINAETQSKVGRRDVSEVKLFQESFRVEPAEIGKPRLRRMEDDGSDLYKSLHIGAMTFAQGCYMAVRNPGSHEMLDELPEHEALEQLAAFSMLARWVDEATVERV